MSLERYARVREIVLGARELEDSARAEWIANACGEDHELRREVEELLAHDRDLASPLMDGGLSGAIAEVWDSASPAGPERIGPYRVLDVLGQGGMGIVYRAEQSEPIRREVAVKIIRRGLDMDRMLARFEAERHAIARMEHPGIARVLDAGHDQDGRPYFVMELVRGVPITEYATRGALDTRARITLFLSVCDAVNHAHQRSIIHRDLKPSNVLVSEHDGRPQPKIIDFGIAKAVAGTGGFAALTTQLGVILGTPEYMSPEQAGAVTAEVDTRTDVWSLGVILHELLTGRRPFDLGDATPAQILRSLGAEGPAAPSSVADGRTRGTLRGDLDAILLRALRRDPDQRYGSVAHFAEDLRRWLEGRPVEARRGTWRYRAGRFVRRHRLAVGIVAAIVVWLAGMAVVLVLQSARVARERDRAVAAEAAARSEAETARKVSEFLVQIFEQADPHSPGAARTAREILDRGAARVREELKDEPVVQARLMDAIGGAYHGIGLMQETEPLLIEALAIRRRALGPDHEEIARTLVRLGALAHDLGEFEQAERYDVEALEMLRRLHGADHADVASSLAAVALDRQVRGDLAGAEPLMREALAMHRRLLGDMSDGVAWDLYALGWLLQRQGRFAAAESLELEAVAIQRQVRGPRHPDVASTLNNLAGVRWELGDYRGSIALLRESYAIYDEAFGPEHAAVPRAMLNLARFLRTVGEYEEAERLARASLAQVRAAPARRPAYLAAQLEGLGGIRLDRGDHREARALLEEALAIRRGLSGSRDANAAIALGELGRLHLERGETAAAERRFREALAEHRALDPAGHPGVAVALAGLGETRAVMGDLAQAETLLREAIAVRERVAPASHPLTAEMRVALGEVLARSGRAEEGQRLMREGIAQMVAGGLSPGTRSLERARRRLAASDARAADVSARVPATR